MRDYAISRLKSGKTYAMFHSFPLPSRGVDVIATMTSLTKRSRYSHQLNRGPSPSSVPLEESKDIHQ